MEMPSLRPIKNEDPISIDKESIELNTVSSSVQFINQMTANKSTNSIIYLKYILTIVAHFCIILYVAIILCLCLFTGDFVLFTWHPLLLSIGWMLLVSEAVLMVSKDNAITNKSLGRKSRIKLHWILQILALSTITAGFIIVYINKNLLKKEHFTSWHGLFGLITVIVVVPTVLMGVFLNSAPISNIPYWLTFNTKKILHILNGTITVLLGGTVSVLGLYTKWFERRANNWFFYFGLAAVLLAISTVLIRPIQTLLHMSRVKK